MIFTMANSRPLIEYFLASWIAVFTIEKFGRRQLMLFGAAGQSFSMIM